MKNDKYQQNIFAFAYFLVCFFLGLIALLNESVFWVYSLVFIVGGGCVLFAPVWECGSDKKSSSIYQDDHDWSGGYNLDRSHQIKQLNYILENVSCDSSVVVGVSGAWGAGKTTLIEKTINIKNKTICRFSPWASYEGKDFIYRFVDELISSIGGDKSINFKSKIKIKWKLYRFAIDVANLPKRNGYREYVAISTMVAGVAILLLHVFGGDWGFKVIDVVNLWVFVSVIAFIYAASFFNGSRGRGNEVFSRSAEFIFKEICRDINEEGIELVVLIDDVDRIDADDFYNLIRVIRFVSVIPKAVFVIVYDEDELRKKLEEKKVVNIKGYMDKLVDYVVDVPMLNRDEVASVVIKSLGSEFSGFPDKYFHESEAFLPRYIDFLDALSVMVDNPRVANKISNDIRLSFECGDIDNFELLDPIDFISVKAIKASSKRVYQWIKEKHSAIVFDEIEEKEINEMLSKEGDGADSTKAMLKMLYPSSKALWGLGMSLSESERVWSIQKNRLFVQKDPSPYFDFSMNDEVKASSYIAGLMTNALDWKYDPDFEAKVLRESFEEGFVYEVVKKISSHSYEDSRLRSFAFIMCCNVGSFASHKMKESLGVGLYEKTVFSLRDMWVNDLEFVDQLKRGLKYFHVPFFDFVRFDVAISKGLIETGRNSLIGGDLSGDLISHVCGLVVQFVDNLNNNDDIARLVFGFSGVTFYLIIETLMEERLEEFIDVVRSDVILVSDYIDSANTGKIGSYGRGDHYQTSLINPVLNRQDVERWVSLYDGKAKFEAAINKLKRYLSFLDRDEPS